MDNTTSEMSLDEILSSIKKMVIDDEPPVLELTEMVSEDGSIVSVKKKNESKPENKGSDMGSFLRLIQEDVTGTAKKVAQEATATVEEVRTAVTNEAAELATTSVATSTLSEAAQHGLPPVQEKQQAPLTSVSSPAPVQGNLLQGLVREILTPLLKDWLEKNLSLVVTKAVEEEVKKFLYKNGK